MSPYIIIFGVCYAAALFSVSRRYPDVSRLLVGELRYGAPGQFDCRMYRRIVVQSVFWESLLYGGIAGTLAALTYSLIG